MKRTFEEIEQSQDEIKIDRFDKQVHAVNFLFSSLYRNLKIKCTDGYYNTNQRLWDNFHFKKKGFAEPKYEIHFKKSTIEAIEKIYLQITVIVSLKSTGSNELCCPVELYHALDYFGLDVEEGINTWFKNEPSVNDLCKCGNSNIMFLKNKAYKTVYDELTDKNCVKYCLGLNTNALEEVLIKRFND